MSWLFLGSLFADSKISILVNLIIFTIILAVVLIIFERRIVKKQVTKKEDDLLNYKVSDFVSKVGNGHTPSERLSIINAVAKTSFSEWFGLKTNVSYTYLSDYFEKRGLPKYHNFSSKMFELFYSANSYSFAEVDRMTKLFVELIRETYELRKAKVSENKGVKSEVEKSKKKSPKNSEKKTKEIEKKPEKKIISWSDIKFKKEVEKKQKEVMVQRQKNVELMKEADEKLKEQKKLEEDLKKSLEEESLNVSGDTKESTSKKFVKGGVPKIQKKEIETPVLINKKTPKDFTKWHKEINLEPVMGKSWLKDYRKKKREGMI